MSNHHIRLHGRRWATVRRTVFERGNFRCVMCGRAGRMEADHIVRMEDDPGQDPYDPNGLQALCRACHVEKTRRENRREPTPAEAAWRVLVNELSGKSCRRQL